MAGTVFSENVHLETVKDAPALPIVRAPADDSLPLLRLKEQSEMSKPVEPKLRREAYSKSRFRMRPRRVPS